MIIEINVIKRIYVSMDQANPHVMEYPTGLVNITAVNSKLSHEVKQEAWQDKIMPDVLQKGY